MFGYEFKSRTALRPYVRTTIAKRRRLVSFPQEQALYNPSIFTWSVLKQCHSNTLRHLANLQEGFRFRDPYEKYRLRRRYDGLPIILFKEREEWTKRSLKPTPAVQYYQPPKPGFKPPSYFPNRNKAMCSCWKRDGLQVNCVQLLTM